MITNGDMKLADVVILEMIMNIRGSMSHNNMRGKRYRGGIVRNAHCQLFTTGVISI